MKLAIVMITARREPHYDWLFDSLALQSGNDIVEQVILVDYYAQVCDDQTEEMVQDRIHSARACAKQFDDITTVVPPKPNVWGGPHRFTKEPWWHISESRNSGICLCRSEFISFLDDRCVLMPGYLPGIRAAMKGNYAAAGAYEKRFGMQVENGVITHGGEVTGRDPRNPKGNLRKPVPTYGGCWCGCNMALPLEWCLEIGGFSELCSGLGLEDVVFGNMLALNNHITKFDPLMAIVEDRTRDPGENMPKRTDKNVSPNDKSHALLDKISGSKHANNLYDIRAVRESVLAGNPFPIPTEPKVDWYDSEPLSQMYVR